jgi:hypothetical protein
VPDGGGLRTEIYLKVARLFPVDGPKRFIDVMLLSARVLVVARNRMKEELGESTEEIETYLRRRGAWLVSARSG